MKYLLLGIHNHQPVGNFDHVFEKACDLAYEPFLEVLERHPGIHVSLHNSGILYEWLESHRPRYLEKLRSLSDSGQVELLGGGFYEPILSMIPEKDQKDQIRKMERYLLKRFKQRPKGIWLAERVWEPSLPKTLSELKVDYTVVDDAHFLSAGFPEQELNGYFLSEFQGKEVKVFPIHKKMRYLIPYAEPEEVIKFLKAAPEGPHSDAAWIMADDGEKLGLWPNTHKRVYSDGWLEKFFSLAEQNKDWLCVLSLGEYAKRFKPRGWAYLPTSSYFEMSEWTLRPEAQKKLLHALESVPEGAAPFVRGGYFRNFFSKYPEANRIYRKMLHVSHELRKEDKNPEALEHLWKGQCNCTYWHGVFGGLYLPHLRQAVYQNLLEAERRGLKGLVPFRTRQEDWDGDGLKEILVESPQANWYWALPGASLWAWDLKNLGVNLQNLVSRRKEAYHGKLAEAVLLETVAHQKTKSIHDITLTKEAGLDKILFYDWHERRTLLDHFLHPHTRLEDFEKAQYGEQGDFVTGNYEAGLPVMKGKSLALSFRRQGNIWGHPAPLALEISKDIEMDPEGGWKASYKITNRSEREEDLWFGVELALAFSEESVCPRTEIEQTGRAVWKDPHFKLALSLDLAPALGLWSFPLYTISQSEEGFEKTYQGSVILCHRKIKLAPGRSEEISLSASVEKLP